MIPDILLAGIRFALFADLMLVTGLAAFLLYALNAGERRSPQIMPDFWKAERWLCAIGLAISIAGMAVLTANMHGVGLFAVDPLMMWELALETDVGGAWIWRTVALSIALIAAFRTARRPAVAAAMITAAGAIALASLIWAGHAGATEGMAGTIHRVSDALHMIAAAVWLGAVAAFLILLGRPGDDTRLDLIARGLDQFSLVGTICVLVIAATGLLNSQMIIGAENIAASLAAPYGQLLLVKLALFGLMLALAGVNRWRLTPALKLSLAESDPAQALGAIRRSLFLEITAGAAILALVAWFGMLEPFPAAG